MKKFNRILSVLLLIVLLLSGCDTIKESVEIALETGIIGLEFSTLKSPLELDTGKTRTGYFEVKGSEYFNIEDIIFKSNDESVATFTYYKTVAKTLVYYTITGISEGTTEIYAETSDGKVCTEKISVTVHGFQYKIVEEDDNSIPIAKRVCLRVTVAENHVEGKSEEYITELMKYVILEYAETHDLNSITVFLYVEGDDTSGGITVGTCTYAPYGELSRASEVEAGDYSTFKFCDITVHDPSTIKLLREIGKSKITE